jgi:hypothetical protein
MLWAVLEEVFQANSTQSSIPRGRPIHIALTAGRRHEMTMADELLEHAHGKALIAVRDTNRFPPGRTR